MTCSKASSTVARLSIGLLSLQPTACASIGPSSVTEDRIDYATSIGNSWKDQTLLNIVQLRYADLPIFLENNAGDRRLLGAGHNRRQFHGSEL